MIDHGGSAFPINGGYHDNQDNGMTLRDYFAAHVLPAFFSDGEGHHVPESAAKWAYSMADAMIVQRNKERE